MDAQTLLDNTVARLRRHRGRYAEIVSAGEGFSDSWLSKIANGKITSPTIDSLQRLIEALDTFEGVSQPQDAAANDPDQDPGATRLGPFEAPP